MLRTVARWGVPVLTVLVSLLLAVPASAHGVGAAPAVSTVHSSLSRHFKLRDSAGLGNVLASHEGTTLLSYLLTNGSSVIDEYTLVGTGPLRLQVLPGGPSEFPSGVAWSETRFLVSIQNITSGTTLYEAFTLRGGFATVSIPEASAGLWTVIGSAGDAVYVSSAGALLALSDDSFAPLRSFDSALPAGADINSVALLAGRLYVGGAISPSSGGAYAFYGAIDLANGMLTTLSPAESYPSTFLTTVLSVVVVDRTVYFGGQSLTFVPTSSLSFQTDGPVFFALQPGSRTIHNLSGELPAYSGIGQLVRLGSALGVVAPFWGFTTEGQLTGAPGFYLGNPATGHLRNETTAVGPDMLVIAFESATSAGQFISMGEHLPTGTTELAVVPFDVLDP